MGQQNSSGLFKRGKYWHVDKQIFGQRIRGSTGATSYQEAEYFLAKRIEEIRQAAVFGVRPKRTFKEAATKFLKENQHKRSIRGDVEAIHMLMGYIGNLPLESIHMGSLQPYIDARRSKVKARTVNAALQVTRRILNLAATEWMDENGLTWLASAPKIRLLPETDRRKPYPISWDEQERLFDALPAHLKKMALFAVNTGCREQVICNLRWEWEHEVPNAPHLTIFIVPGDFVKNGDDRLIVCNEVAKSVIDSARGMHPEFVFVYKGKPTQRINNKGWREARIKTGLERVRVHDLKHTFGRRLRAAGVSFEDRQDLLGHRSGRITTHYSAAEIGTLYEAANSVCQSRKRDDSITSLRLCDVVRKATQQLKMATPTKSPQYAHEG